MPAGADKAKLKVKVTLNLNGVVTLEQVQMIEETEEVVEEQVGARACVGGPCVMWWEYPSARVQPQARPHGGLHDCDAWRGN